MPSPTLRSADGYALGNRWGTVTPGLVRCTDCRGSGAAEPDCDLCKGERHVPLAEAEAAGYDRSDGLVTEAYGNEPSTMTCPECGGCLCGRCSGTGEVEADLVAQERDRVLICALAGGRRIPTLYYRDRAGVMQREDVLLGDDAGADLHRSGHVHRTLTLLGDRLSLTPAGRPEAKAAWRRYRQRQRAWIAQERALRHVA